MGGRVAAYISNASSGEIHSIVVDIETSEIVAHTKVAAGALVMPLAVSPTGTHLYASVRSKPYEVVTYAIDPLNGGLSEAARAALPDSMVSLSLDRQGKWLFGISYGSGMLSVSPVDPDGAVRKASCHTLLVGRYGHAVWADATNSHVYASSLGDDKIVQCSLNSETGQLAAISSMHTSIGHGPRHFVFSPDNQFVYVINEMSGEILQSRRSEGSGELLAVESYPSLPTNTQLTRGVARPPMGAGEEIVIPEAPCYCADIAMTPDGRFIYSTERTSSTLSHLERNAVSGGLRLVDCYTTEHQPRGIQIDPTGTYLFVTGEKSEFASVYAIDPQSGSLSAVLRVPIGLGGNWVSVVHLH
jgi:6-phosphogluconolactonase